MARQRLLRLVTRRYLAIVDYRWAVLACVGLADGTFILIPSLRQLR